MHENFPVGAIITNGLGADACQGFVIQTQFHLFCFTAAVYAPAASGGTRPLAPGEIQNFYKPVDPWLTPTDLDPLAPPKNYVVIRVTMKGKTYEKEYLVPPKRYKTVLKIINLSNVTKERISAAVSGLKRIVTRAVVSVTNLRKKK